MVCHYMKWLCSMSSIYVLFAAISLIVSFTDIGSLTAIAFTVVSSTTGKVAGRPLTSMRMSESSTAMNESIDQSASAYPFAIIVQAEIVPDRLQEFLKLIEINAVNSRREPECLRFDVVQSQEKSNLFFFYEVYTNDSSAINHHKAQPHYQLWADFKASGGTVSSVTYKANGKFLT
jgi:quinol monooxygenase YgiN